MKKVSFKRLFQYSVVIVLTLLICFCILLFKSHKSDKQNKYFFSRKLYKPNFVVQTNSIFDSLDTKGSKLFSYNCLIMKDNLSAYVDMCTLIDFKGNELKKVLIPEKCMTVVAYVDSCLFWIKNLELRCKNIQNGITKNIFFRAR